MTPPLTTWTRQLEPRLHADFIREIEAACGTLPASRKVRLAVVPGAFYREYRQTGAPDGGRFVGMVRGLNVQTEIAFPPSRWEPFKENGRIITQWLAQRLRARRRSSYPGVVQQGKRRT